MKTTIDMAREAGARLADLPNGYEWLFDSEAAIKAFEALVRADEREVVEGLLKEYDMVNSAFAKDFRARGQE
jgi:hypothetical protein